MLEQKSRYTENKGYNACIVNMISVLIDNASINCTNQFKNTNTIKSIYI